MSEQEFKVLDAVTKNPLASQQELATLLNMSRESVAGHIMRLTRKGKILGKGYVLPQQNNLVVIGGCNLDITGSSYNNVLPADSNPGIISHSAGGVGRNIAENLARLGNQVTLISAVGLDDSGNWLLEQCRNIGINMNHVIRRSDKTTGTYIAINNPNGELSTALADMTILDCIDNTLLAQKLPVLSSTNTLLVEANINPSCINWLAGQNLRAAIYADAVSATKAVHLRPLLSSLTCIKVNREEAKAILDIPSQTAVSDEELIQQLLAKGVKSILLSLGSEGVLFANEKESIKQAVFPTEAVSDTGAGDALLSGFMHGQLSQWDIHETLEFSCACAALTLAHESANNPDINEINIKNWMATQ